MMHEMIKLRMIASDSNVEAALLRSRSDVTYIAERFERVAIEAPSAGTSKKSKGKKKR
jgi:hypothetical protein